MFNKTWNEGRDNVGCPRGQRETRPGVGCGFITPPSPGEVAVLSRNTCIHPSSAGIGRTGTTDVWVADAGWRNACWREATIGNANRHGDGGSPSAVLNGWSGVVTKSWSRAVFVDVRTPCGATEAAELSENGSPFRGVAQLVEHRSPKPGVGSSNPPAPAFCFRTGPASMTARKCKSSGLP